jgi:Protein phosphatase 2C
VIRRPAHWLRGRSRPHHLDHPGDAPVVDEDPVTPVVTSEDAPGDEPPAPPATEPDEPASSDQEPAASPTTGELRDLSTRAPHVGRLRAPVPPVLKPATALRPASATLDGLRCGDYCIAAASIVGSSHLQGGTPRQDGYDFVVTPSRRLVVAVADGLGSRPYSQLGARLFGEQVVQLALEQPDAAAEWYLTEAADRVGLIAPKHYGLSVRDVGFVAEVAVLEADVCTLARVGDVSAFARLPEGEFVELFAGDDNGSMNAVSESLPSPAEPQVVKTQSDRIVFTTDGLAGDIRLSPGVRTWLREQWSAPVSAFLMGDSLRFRRQGSHDDRTAVVVWHRPEDPS